MFKKVTLVAKCTMLAKDVTDQTVFPHEGGGGGGEVKE